MTKVRMTQQVSGTRNGQNWPEPGMEVDVSDAEARALIQGNAATAVDYKADTVLVPPAGVHTPGRTAYGDVDLVEVPVDAVADPEAAVAAHRAASGVVDASKQVPAGSSVQNHDGSAMTAKQIDEALKADEQTAKDLGLPSPQDKAPAGTAKASTSATTRAGESKSTESSKSK